MDLETAKSHMSDFMTQMGLFDYPGFKDKKRILSLAASDDDGIRRVADLIVRSEEKSTIVEEIRQLLRKGAKSNTI